MIPNKNSLLLSAILISALSQASQDPIDVVTREEFNALQEKVGSLESSIDALTESITALSDKMDQTNADNKQKYVSNETKILTIGGNYDTFYPVVFDASVVKINTLHINHHIYAYPNNGDHGNFRFLIEMGSYGWGSWPAYTQPVLYNYNNIPYVAKYRQGAYGKVLVLWLRGGAKYSYQFSSDLPVHVYLEKTNLTPLYWPTLQNGEYPDWVEPTKDIDAHMVPNGFRRWDASTYGSYQASIAQPQQAAASIFPLINK